MGFSRPVFYTVSADSFCWYSIALNVTISMPKEYIDISSFSPEFQSWQDVKASKNQFRP